MIYVAYGEIDTNTAPRQYIHNIDGFFDDYIEDSWMLEQFAKKTIHDIDKSEIIAPKIIESPVLEQIPRTWISGGSKLLIMMNVIQDVIYDGDNLGDNCWPLFLELGKTKDIAISLSYYPSFEWPNGAKIYNLDTQTIISNREDFISAFLSSAYANKERQFNEIAWPIKINQDRFSIPDIDFD